MRISTAHPLEKLKVIVTRPQHQAQPLCQSIEKLGAQTISLPSITIEAIDFMSSLEKGIAPITQQDIALFLSANAVIHSQHFWKSLTTLPKMFAIGPGTAHALQAAGLPIHAIPHDYCSEGLLELDGLQHVADKKIFICSGADTRPLLAETLKKRGANTIPIVCYRRHYPTPSQETLRQLSHPTETITIITSREGLVNFHHTIDDAKLTWLLNQPLLVSHPTHKPLAKQFGFKNIITANNPTDVEIITRLIHYAEHHSCPQPS